MSDLVNLGFKADTGGLTRAQNELDKTAVAGGRLDKQNSITTRSLGLVGTAIAAVGVTASLQQLIKYTDSWSNLNTQLRQVTSSEEQLLSVRERLLQVSRETRIDLDATVGLYAEMTRGTSDLNISSDKLVEITKTLNNLFLAGGKPLSEMTGAIRQLNQGFASGVLRGDEFNSVAEGAPRIMDALSASLGKTRGELRAFAATGGITSAVMIKALESYSGTAQQLANTVKLTFEQTMGLVKTNVTQFVGESELIGSAVDNLGGSLLSLSQNIEATAYALGAAGAVIATAYGVKTTAAIGASITATYARIKADGEALVAQRTLEAQTARTTLVRLESAAAESNIALKVEAANAARLRSSIAAFDAEFALEAQRQRAQISETGRIQSGLRMSEINASRAITTNQLTASETALSAALARTTAAETAATVGKARLGAATAAVTTATVAQTTASRALGVATSFLMGPWGILIAAVGLGAATFLTASDNIDEATASAERHAKAMSELETIYSKWNKTRLEGERDKLLARSNEILFERLDIEEKIQKLSANATMQRGMETIVNPEVLAEIERLEKSLVSLGNENENIDNSLGKVLAALDAFITKKKEATSTVDKSVEANRKLADSYNSQILSLHNQRTALQMTGDEFELYTAKQTALMYGATEAMLENVEKQVKALQKSRKEFELFANFEETMNAPDWIASMGGDLDSVESKIDSFGGAWSRTGSVIVDAFGDMGDAMNSYMQSMDELSSIQKELDAEKKKSGADLVKIAKLEQSVNEKKVSAELSGYKSLASGAAGMFSEKTAAAKAFTAISQVMAVTEIALSYQKMAAGTAETAVHVTNETTKQSANALTAITAAFAAPFPVGFVAGAAMIGIMASLLGGAFGGGGGGSYTAPEIGGTGTVLGDGEAQSASITNAFDKLEDIELDQLSELRGIRSSMQALSNGIANLAKSLVSGLDFGDTGYAGRLGTTDEFNMPSLINKMPTFIDPLLSILDGFVGGIIGSFSSTKKELLDSGITFVSQTFAEIFESGQVDASVFQVIETTKKKFWGASKKTRVSTEYSDIDDAIVNQMADIFGFIGDSVLGAVNSLFNDSLAEEMLSSFQIDIGDISFKDKTGEEIQKELEAIFSQQADLMTSYLIPQMNKFQQMGEGLFETLMRVTQEQAIFNDAMERTGYEYQKFVTSIEKVDFAQAIIGMVGGIEQFSELSNSFFESLYSDAEQFAYLESSLGSAFDSLGLSIVGSREEFKDLINGIDITTESGQALYAALLELVPGMDKYLEALEDEEAAKAEAAKRLADQTQNVTLRLLEEQGRSEEALAMRRQMELDAADGSLHSMLKMIYALEDSAMAEAERAKEIQAAEQLLNQSKNLQIRLLTAQGESEAALALTREMELASTDESLRGLLSLIHAQEDANKLQSDAQSALESTSNELNNAVSGFRSISESLNAIIYGAYDAIEVGVTKLDDALKMSRSGNFSGASGLSVEGAIGNTSNYESIASYNFARDVALNKIAEIRDLSVSAEDVTERAIQAIDANIANVAVDIFEQKASLSSIKDTNTSTDSNVLELVKTMKQDSESQQEGNKELIILLEKMNKDSVAANKILKRIEYNAQYITPTE